MHKNNNIITECSIKRNLLKRWIYENKHTQPYVARKMQISTHEFKRKLLEQEPFSMRQIQRLINLMGAEQAFKVIFYPTFKDRNRIYKEAFENNEEGELIIK